MRRTSLVLLTVMALIGVGTAASPASATDHSETELDVIITRAPVDPNGDVAGHATDLVVTFADPDPAVPGIGLAAGGTITIGLPEEFINTQRLPVAATGSAPDCAPPLVAGCSTAVLLQGWPQSPVLPFPGVSWDGDTNRVIITAVADWYPVGLSAPGPKQVHLQLFGFDNPQRSGNHELSLEIRPDPSSDVVLYGSGRVHIARRTSPSVNANRLGNGAPPPPFANTLFQDIAAGSRSLTMVFYLWGRHADPLLGVNFEDGSKRMRTLLDSDAMPIGRVRVKPPAGAESWSLVAGGPSTAAAAIITGITTGRLSAALETDPDATGTYEIEISIAGGNSVKHLITTR